MRRQCPYPPILLRVARCGSFSGGFRGAAQIQISSMMLEGVLKMILLSN